MWQPVLCRGPCGLLHRAVPLEGDFGKFYGFGVRGRVGTNIGEFELLDPSLRSKQDWEGGRSGVFPAFLQGMCWVLPR